MICPFLNFGGQCAEAIALYETVFMVTDKRIQRFADLPDNPMPPEMAHYVLHAEMRLNGSEVWLGDTPHGVTPGDMVTLSVPLATAAAVRVAFEKLKVGGEVFQEPTPQFYTPLSAAVADRFGVIWHLLCREA